jgi:YggT family protein
MLANALIYLISVVCGLYTFALLLRFYLQWVRAPYRNPIAHFVRRFVPGLWGLDLSSLLLAWLIQIIEHSLTGLIRGMPFTANWGPVASGIAFLSLLAIVKLILYIVLFATLLLSVLSWLAPQSPAAPVLDTMTRPALAVVRRYCPDTGQIDLSPLILLVLIQLLLMLPIAWLESLALQLLR